MKNAEFNASRKSRNKLGVLMAASALLVSGCSESKPVDIKCDGKEIVRNYNSEGTPFIVHLENDATYEVNVRNKLPNVYGIDVDKIGPKDAVAIEVVGSDDHAYGVEPDNPDFRFKIGDINGYVDLRSGKGYSSTYGGAVIACK